LFSFMRGQKYLYGHAEPSNPESLTEKVFGPVNREWLIYLLSLPFLAVIWLLVQHEPVVYFAQHLFLIVAIVSIILYSMVHERTTDNNKTAYLFAAGAIILGVVALIVQVEFVASTALVSEFLLYAAIALIVAFIVYGFKTHNSAEFGRTVVLMILILSTVVFWALFEQSAGSMTLYADRVVDREVGGITFTAGQFGSLNAGFIMLLSIPFAALWVWLAKRNLEPSTPVKFGLGILQAGLGFGVLVLGAQFPDQAGKVPAIWLALAYLLHTTGELCLSPVGLSAVTKLSISRVVGVSMGTWFLATALSETVATRLGKLAAIQTTGGEATDVASALANYTNLFEFLMYVGIGAGLFVFLISPLLRRAMHGIH